MKLKNVLIISLMTIALLLLASSNIFAKTVTVNVDTLKLREKPSTDSDSQTLKLLDYGQKLEYVDEEDDWYKVSLNGTIGYVSKKYTKLDETEENKEEKQEEEQEKEEEQEEIEQEEQESEEKIKIKEYKLVKTSNLYILPLINANIIEEVKNESNVKVLSKAGGWAYVETDNAMGWIRQDALGDSTVVSDDKEPEKEKEENKEEVTEKEEKTADTEITPKIMYVNYSSVYVRKGPGTNYDVVESVILNDMVKVTAENGDWYKVEVDKTIGYIAKRLLSNKETEVTTRSENTRTTTEKPANESEITEPTATTYSSSKGQEIVDFAKKYLGCKYVYGAAGPNSFDCSGFTMFVYKNFGVTLSHSATAQSKVGTPVSKDNLQPGDLVFFTDFETGVGIGHVGIYVGDGEFIHASSGTGYCVKYSNLTSGSYLKRYETARRIV